MNLIQTIALILLLTSTLPLLFCLIKIYRLRNYKAKAVLTQALVIAAEKRNGFKNSTYYLLIINYKVNDSGLLYSTQAVSGKKYSPGDSIRLMYMPEDPVKFSIDFGQSLKWLLPFSVIFLALICCLCYWLFDHGYL